MNRQELGAQLNLKVEIIPAGMQNRPATQISATYITIHNTSNPNPGADADAHSRFVRTKGYYTLPSGKKNYVSWHYTVDDKCVVKQLPVNERAIHAGSGNGRSVAIEICMHAGIDQDAADLRAAKLVAVLMYDLNIPKANIKPHKHWTGKNCPTLLLSKLDQFCDKAEEFRAAITPTETEDQADGDEAITSAEVEAVRVAREAGVEDEAGVVEDDPENRHELVAEEVLEFIDIH